MNQVNAYVYLSIFFFKQKTSYEMRISDWSSDVCSSDLRWDRRACAASAATGDSVQKRSNSGIYRRDHISDMNPPPFSPRLRKKGLGSAIFRSMPARASSTQPASKAPRMQAALSAASRSAARRVGKVCVSTFKSWWLPDY